MIPCDMLTSVHEHDYYSRRERKRLAVAIDGKSVDIWVPRRLVRGVDLQIVAAFVDGHQDPQVMWCPT
jgi:hypothetical protein